MYDVVVLVERQMSEIDAGQVTSLHEGLEEPVAYHLLLPVEEAAVRVQTSMGALTGLEPVPSAAPVSPEDIDRLQREVVAAAENALSASLALFHRTGHRADGRVTGRDPIDALAEMVAAHEAAEAIILTAPHAVREFFHVDWTSRARRRLGVPTLHLLEHETFEEQSSGAGEGNTIL